MKKLWEILVPKYDNSGKNFRMPHHHEWDNFVRNTTQGVTIMRTSKGMWNGPDGRIYNDKMIPCRIYCTTEEIKKIIAFTMEHYRQLAVMAYVISTEVLLVNKKDIE